MKNVSVVAVAVAVALLFASGTAFCEDSEFSYRGVCDGRIFSMRMLGDLNENAKVDLDEIGNGMTVGNPSGWQTATKGNPATPLAGQDPIVFESAELPRAYWNNSAVTNMQTFVRFPQTSISVDGVVSNAEQAITVPYVPDAERPLRSGFFRFRWDGYAFTTVSNAVIFGDGWTWASANESSRGYAFYVAPTPADGVDRLYLWVGGKNSYVNSWEIEPGEWYDVSYRFISESRVEVTIRKNWTTSRTVTLNYTHTLKFNASANVIIGGQNEAATKWKNDAGTAAGRKVFKGAIAELEIFDASLSKEEMDALAAGQSGAEWAIGSVNGSSYEFGADPHGVYDPRTMEWGEMRGELTAAFPSLTLRTKVRKNDDGRAKILSIVPLLDGVGASCPLTVSVNGNSVGAWSGGTVDMAVTNSRDVFIPGKLWHGDEDGYVSVSLTRQAPVVGTLAFDAMTLSGSWQVGTAGDGAGEFSPENRCPPVFFVGDDDTTNHVRRATYPIGGNMSTSNHVLRAWLPDRVVANDVSRYCKARFAMRISNASSADAFLFKVLVGDSVVWTGTVIKGDTITFDIPRNVFRSGYNDISVQNWSEGPMFWSQYDYFRLDIKPVSGMCLIVL